MYTQILRAEVVQNQEQPWLLLSKESNSAHSNHVYTYYRLLAIYMQIRSYMCLGIPQEMKAIHIHVYPYIYIYVTGTETGTPCRLYVSVASPTRKSRVLIDPSPLESPVSRK